MKQKARKKRGRKLVDNWHGRIRIYDDHSMLEVRGPEGISCQAVKTSDLAAVFTGLKVNTGLLPHRTLFYGQGVHGNKVGVFVPPQTYQVVTKQRPYSLPLPGFVFVGTGRNYEIYAVEPVAWPEAHTTLYHAPLPNVYDSGKVCPGNITFPDCDANTIWEAWDMVMNSYFTGDLVTKRCQSFESIYQLWDLLDGVDEFPYIELVPRHGMTVGNLARGE